MKRLGCALILLGLLADGAGVLSFFRVFRRALQAKRVLTASLETSKPLRTASVTVQTDRLCRVSIKLDLKTHSIREEMGGDETEYIGRYSYPFSCTVLDSSGKELFRQERVLAWNIGTKITRTSIVGARGARVVVEHLLKKFKVTPPGEISIEAKIEPDTRYNSVLQSSELILYDNVSEHTLPALMGAGLFVGGGLLFIAGLVLYVLGRTSTTSYEQGNSHP